MPLKCIYVVAGISSLYFNHEVTISLNSCSLFFFLPGDSHFVVIMNIAALYIYRYVLVLTCFYFPFVNN